MAGVFHPCWLVILSFTACLNAHTSNSVITPANAAELGIPSVKDVSAMCSVDRGTITASIEFDRPFSGRIYSMGFEDSHPCVYYNGFFTKHVLFSIPIYGCGTRATENTRELIDYVENRVYVQIDKYTLSIYDKKYAFVCELAPMLSSSSPALHPTSYGVSNAVGVRDLEGASRDVRRHPSLRPIVPVNFAGEKRAVVPLSTLHPTPPMMAIMNTNLEPTGSATGDGPRPIVPAQVSYGGSSIDDQQRQRNPLSLPPDPFAKSDTELRSLPSESGRGLKMSPPSIPTTAMPPDPFAASEEAPGNRLYSERQAPTTPIDSVKDDHDPSLQKEFGDLNSGSVNYERINQSYRDKALRTSTTSSAPTTTGSVSPPSQWSTIPLFDTITGKFNELSLSNGVATAYFAPNASTRTTSKPPVRMYANQKVVDSAAVSSVGVTSLNSSFDKSIFLEIRRGEDPVANSSRIYGGSVRIGEPIILVVHGKAASNDPSQFNIFVHSCHSSDGTDENHIQLIDNAGCAVHPQVLGGMERRRVNDGSDEGTGEIIYYFSLKAFKFPTRSDVYFFCSVDVSPDYNFPEVCPKKKRLARAAADSHHEKPQQSATLQTQEIDKLLADIHELMVQDNFSVDALDEFNAKAGATSPWQRIKGLNHVSPKQSQILMLERSGDGSSALTSALAVLAAFCIAVTAVSALIFKEKLMKLIVDVAISFKEKAST